MSKNDPKYARYEANAIGGGDWKIVVVGTEGDEIAIAETDPVKTEDVEERITDLIIEARTRNAREDLGYTE